MPPRGCGWPSQTSKRLSQIRVRQGKERQALVNISGAMMIQGTIPSALGLFFTPWVFDGPLMAAVVVTMLAVVFLWLLFRRCVMDSR